MLDQQQESDGYLTIRLNPGPRTTWLKAHASGSVSYDLMHGIEMDLTQIDVSNIMNGLQQILGVIQSGDDVRKGERLDIPLEKGGGYFNVAEWTGSGTFFLRNNYGDTEYLVADADSLQSLLSAFRKIQTVLESNH